MALMEEIKTVLNRHSAENGSNTPDFILAEYLHGCLKAFDAATRRRDHWYSMHMKPGDVRKLTEEEWSKRLEAAFVLEREPSAAAAGGAQEGATQ